MSNVPSVLISTNSSNMTVENFALHCIGTLSITKKTRESYLSALRCHVVPLIGETPMDRVSQSDLLELLASLSPPIRAKVLSMLKSVFRAAISLGYIHSSPAALIAVPKPFPKKIRFLTYEELLSSNLGRYRTEILFLALHGLRWGEAVVLEESDIRGGRIYISRSIHGNTKSRAGVRTLPLVSEFKPFPKSPKTLRKITRELGITIHSLRHTYAYTLKSQGIHVTTAQRLLGHADIKVTLGLYTQVLDEEIDVAGNILRNYSQKLVGTPWA